MSIGGLIKVFLDHVDRIPVVLDADTRHVVRADDLVQKRNDTVEGYLFDHVKLLAFRRDVLVIRSYYLNQLVFLTLHLLQLPK